MTMKQLVDAAPALQKIAAQPLRVRTLYALRRLLDKAYEHLSFYEERRNAILAECGKFEDGKFVCFEGKEEDLESRIIELLDVELDCDIRPVIIPAEENMRLSYNDIKALGGLIDIEFDETESEAI